MYYNLPMSRLLLLFIFISLPISGSVGLDGFLQPKKSVALCAFQTLNHMEVIVDSAKPIRKVTYVRARWVDWHENRTFIFDEGDEVQVLKLTNNDRTPEYNKRGPTNRVFYFTLKPQSGAKAEDLEKYYNTVNRELVESENAPAPTGWQSDMKNAAGYLDHQQMGVSSSSCDEKCLRMVLIDRQTTDAEALAACNKLL